MSKYIVTARVARLMAGVLILSAEQSKPRAHNLKALGKNRFEIVNPVEFKAGEEFCYEGELPKSLADLMADADKTEFGKKSTRPRVGVIHKSPTPTESPEPTEQP